MKKTYTCIASPIGPLLLTAQDDRLTGVYMDGDREGIIDKASTHWTADGEAWPLAEASRQLAAYFAGSLTEFDLPLAPHGTAFQKRVWDELQRIGYGQTVSYGEVARRIGTPGASRAVGLANGSNPISIVVPCHRVIGANGKLVGYGGGLDVKERLLRLEGAIL
jgi:methylated-DNA-[protein]-cysteine S-methyltransferase